MKALSSIAFVASGLVSRGISVKMDNVDLAGAVAEDLYSSSGIPNIMDQGLADQDVSTSATRDLLEVDPSGNVKKWEKPTVEEHEYIKATKSRRMRERRERVRQKLANMKPESKLERMSKEELEKAYENAKEDGIEKEQHQWIRRAMEHQGRSLWGNNNADAYYQSNLADNTEYYDKWQQAYRFLGGFIDCDHSKSQGSHDNKNNKQGQNDDQYSNTAAPCSRWMMWAAYVDPNYSGGGYDEYFGDDAVGYLDCHSPDTDWILVGVYRQEFYQYIEQISKHLWAINEYEYIVALAGLKYMTKYECFGVGYDEYGNQLYASVQPLEEGKFQMGLYSDTQCLILASTSYTYDDFGQKSDLYLGSKDQTDDDAFHYQAYQYWYDTQEYTFQNLNTVYSDFKFCTSCVDYPTYQDGYFIGDDGRDDDDLINQCWKFYSHSSYNCDADCIAMGAQQGTITWVAYNGKQFGKLIDGQYNTEHEKNRLGDDGTTTSEASASENSHRLEKLKANLFLTVAGIIFVATFLAFAVARGSSKKKASSRSRSRRLLDADYQASSGERPRSSRSASRSRVADKDERSSSFKSRSKSRSGATGSSRSRSKSAARSGSGSDYVPPSDSRHGEKEKEREKSERRKSRSQSQPRKKSSSSRQVDDF